MVFSMCYLHEQIQSYEAIFPLSDLHLDQKSVHHSGSARLLIKSVWQGATRHATLGPPYNYHSSQSQLVNNIDREQGIVASIMGNTDSTQYIVIVLESQFRNETVHRSTLPNLHRSFIRCTFKFMVDACSVYTASPCQSSAV